MRIIHRGDPSRGEGNIRATCGKCGTVFAYAQHDVRFNQGDAIRYHYGEEADNDRIFYDGAHECVYCPVCGATHITQWIGKWYD